MAPGAHYNSQTPAGIAAKPYTIGRRYSNHLYRSQLYDALVMPRAKNHNTSDMANGEWRMKDAGCRWRKDRLLRLLSVSDESAFVCDERIH